MSYEEAVQHSMTVRWKINTCSQGEICWCRIVEPEVPIFDDEGNEVYIAGSGSLPKEYAEYIVKLHNKHLEK